MLTPGDGLSGDAACTIICSADCHLDENSECPRTIQNLLTGNGKWVCPADEATIEISKYYNCFRIFIISFIKDLGRLAVVSKIEIQWWGDARSRNFHVDIDTKRVINYEEKVFPGFNGWTKFENIFATGSSIRFTLTDGKVDYWGYNKKFGIKQLNIYGRYVAEDENKLENNNLKLMRQLYLEQADSNIVEGNNIRI